MTFSILNAAPPDPHSPPPLHQGYRRHQRHLGLILVAALSAWLAVAFGAGMLTWAFVEAVL